MQFQDPGQKKVRIQLHWLVEQASTQLDETKFQGCSEQRCELTGHLEPRRRCPWQTTNPEHHRLWQPQVPPRLTADMRGDPGRA